MLSQMMWQSYKEGEGEGANRLRADNGCGAHRAAVHLLCPTEALHVCKSPWHREAPTVEFPAVARDGCDGLVQNRPHSRFGVPTRLWPT